MDVLVLFLPKHGFLIHWLIIYTDVYVCMRDTAKISMINTQHTTFTSNDSTVYFSWNQSKAHVYYLQLCTVCVCVCVCLHVCEHLSACGLNVKVSGGWVVSCLHWRAVYGPQWRRWALKSRRRNRRWSQGALTAVHCGYVGWSITAVVEWAEEDHFCNFGINMGEK